MTRTKGLYIEGLNTTINQMTSIKHVQRELQFINCLNNLRNIYIES